MTYYIFQRKSFAARSRYTIHEVARLVHALTGYFVLFATSFAIVVRCSCIKIAWCAKKKIMHLLIVNSEYHNEAVSGSEGQGQPSSAK